MRHHDKIMNFITKINAITSYTECVCVYHVMCASLSIITIYTPANEKFSLRITEYFSLVELRKVGRQSYTLCIFTPTFKKQLSLFLDDVWNRKMMKNTLVQSLFIAWHFGWYLISLFILSDLHFISWSVEHKLKYIKIANKNIFIL